jgi:hypothetical protein
MRPLLARNGPVGRAERTSRQAACSSDRLRDAQKQQFRTSDYKCTFLDSNVDRKFVGGEPIDTVAHRSGVGIISERSSMLRNAVVVFAIVLTLGTSGLSNSAFAYGGGGGEDGFLRNHSGGFVATPSNGHGGHDNRVGGLRDGYRGYGSRDVWGHRGAYHGPMVPSIF